ncbi:MAG TPA: toll/interleukin-1 receptor domain-containing protein [Pyrinomonadaceae bacterium]|nr:toll/interleukin-1 receptor domain-containing protein [Pyrinomonadaceae bacterium]
MPREYRHVFLSYSRVNEEEVRQLREDLINADENVWWDQDIRGGQDWQQTIREALKTSYAVVVCFSKETEASTESGIYPELRDAISTYRNLAEGEIFLIPIRLSECEIPDVEIDAVRTLARLQRIDLFPAENRDRGVNALLEAIRSSSRHP